MKKNSISISLAFEAKGISDSVDITFSGWKSDEGLALALLEFLKREYFDQFADLLEKQGN